MFRLSIVFIFIISTSYCLFAQDIQEVKPQPRFLKGNYSQKIDPSLFDDILFNEVLIKELNAELQHINERLLDEHSILSRAAKGAAVYMAGAESTKIEEGGKNLTLQKRIEDNGGASSKTIELTFKYPIKEGKDTLTFAQLAANCVFDFFNKEKVKNQLINYKFLFVGVGSAIDVAQKKIYVSVILGNYHVENKGASLIATSKIPVTPKLKFKPYDSKICKPVDKVKQINEFQNGLKVVNGEIIFETDRFKDLKKLLKESSDGFAVDIVQRDQYPCSGENITDNRIGSYGFVTNFYSSAKLLKMNQIEGKEARDKFKVSLGSLPQVAAPYELNLIIVQQKYMCASVMHTYVEVGDMQNVSKIKIIADTLMAFSSMGYVPKPDTINLSFKIPFELGKFEYNQDDVKPFLDALNELDYNILNLKISAFSSIEGEEEKNQLLREKRAQAIMNAIQMIKGESLETEIITSDSWDMFFTDIEGTEFDTLKKLSREEITLEINKVENIDKYEPILSKHRFAKIEMRVVYDIDSDKKEQDFVMKKFQETVDQNDFVTALKMQKYIMKKTMREDYTPEVASLMKLPKDSANFAGMQINQLWLDYAANNKPVDSLFWAEVMRLQILDPDNDYIAYNRVYCEIKFNPIVDEIQIGQMQQLIDDLATSTLQKSVVDQLNLEYQLKILQSIDDTFEPTNKTELIKTVVERIKNIVNFKDNDYRSALDLAYLFIGMKDYEFAMQILEPLITQSEVDEGVLFTYISLCTNIKDKFQTQIFEKALVKASKMNVDRFCNLLREGKLSFQFFENPNVKGVFCKTCFE